MRCSSCLSPFGPPPACTRFLKAGFLNAGFLIKGAAAPSNSSLLGSAFPSDICCCRFCYSPASQATGGHVSFTTLLGEGVAGRSHWVASCIICRYPRHGNRLLNPPSRYRRQRGRSAERGSVKSVCFARKTNRYATTAAFLIFWRVLRIGRFP